MVAGPVGGLFLFMVAGPVKPLFIVSAVEAGISPVSRRVRGFFFHSQVHMPLGAALGLPDFLPRLVL